MGKARWLIYSGFMAYISQWRTITQTRTLIDKRTHNSSYYLHLCFIGPILTPALVMDGCVFFPFRGAKWARYDCPPHAPVPSHKNRKWLDRVSLWYVTDKRSMKALLKRNIHHRNPQAVWQRRKKPSLLFLIGLTCVSALSAFIAVLIARGVSLMLDREIWIGLGRNH